MTTLTRLRLNPRSRAVRRDLADCHHMHRTVMGAFPTDHPGQPRAALQVLYRYDLDQRGRPTLLLQSAICPEWTHLPANYLAADPASKSVDEAYAAILAGTELTFRLRANATKRVAAHADPLHGKRVELQTYEEQVAWLGRKAEHAGFGLLHVRTVPGVPDVRAVQSGKQHGRRRGARLTLAPTIFEGRLRVTDPDRFRDALMNGIGSGKAYGFGLLSIAPA